MSCVFCNRSEGTIAPAWLATRTFGREHGVAHADCAKAAMDVLKTIDADPVTWPGLLLDLFHKQGKVLPVMYPCALCDQNTNASRVYSAVAAQAFGAMRGSVHTACLDNATEALKGVTPDPTQWPAILRTLMQSQVTQ